MSHPLLDHRKNVWIFNEFRGIRIDKKLPKFNKVSKDNVELTTRYAESEEKTYKDLKEAVENGELGEIIMISTPKSNNHNVDISDWDWDINLRRSDERQELEGLTKLDKVKNYLLNLLRDIWGKVSNEEARFDVVRFFAKVKEGVIGDSEAYKNRVVEIIEGIGFAELGGQTALKEKLFYELVINKLESILVSNKMYKVITADTLVSFARSSKCTKNLCLDYIENFVRPIPVEVMKKKVAADKLEVFDNYVVLHYDPRKESTEMTREEIRKKKDPILFGLIRGSKKLYYIADWVDEYCDLTFDQIVDAVGKELIEKEFLK